MLQEEQIQVEKTSSIYQFDPFVNNGIFCIGGWLNNTDIHEELKHPIIMQSLALFRQGAKHHQLMR